MRMYQMKCNQCNAPLDIDLDNLIAFCPYCGQKLLFDVTQLQDVIKVRIKEQERTTRETVKIREREQTKRERIAQQTEQMKESTEQMKAATPALIVALLLVTLIMAPFILGILVSMGIIGR